MCIAIETSCIIHRLLFILFTVPILNAVNFSTKLEKVQSWWKLGVALLVLWNKLDEIERVYTKMQDRLKAMYDYFKHMHPYANWRCVIWALDECGETKLADEIRSYAEPITGKNLIVGHFKLSQYISLFTWLSDSS